MTEKNAVQADRSARLYRLVRSLAVLTLVAGVALLGWLALRPSLQRAGIQDVTPAAQAGDVVPGPDGPVRSLAATSAEEELYLATAGGLFHSAGEGGGWTELALPLEPGPGGLADVAVNPRSPSTLFVAGDGVGVLRSDDAGATWASVASGLPSDRVRALAMHTFNFDTLYADLEGDDLLYETRDGGQSWREPVEGPPAEAIAFGHSSLVGSMNTGWLYATTSEGVYLSMD